MDRNGRDRTDRADRNALHYAVLNHQENAALDLINRGIDINARDGRYRPPLWYAARNGLESVVILPLRNDEINSHIDGRVNRENRGIWTNPEEEAERAGHKEIAKMIRERKELKKGKESDLLSG